MGEVCADQGAVLTPGFGDGTRIHVPVPAFLLETDDGSNVMIDTGMHRSHIDDPHHTWRGHELDDLLVAVMRPEDYLSERLAQIGFAPSSVTHVINTHLHWDHTGGNELFPGVPIIVQRGHYESARNNPLFPSENWDRPELIYQLIDGEMELFPGVEIILTPGHVPFHQSILVRLPKCGPILICADAIPLQVNIDQGAWKSQMDPEAARTSAIKLLERAERENATLIFGHDPDQWRTLRHSPEFYD
jgi:N-acyl homoserine lactone hydrolase